MVLVAARFIPLQLLQLFYVIGKVSMVSVRLSIETNVNSYLRAFIGDRGLCLFVEQHIDDSCLLS